MQPFDTFAPWRGASLGRALLAGLVGSIANSLAIRIAQTTPIPPGTGGLAKMTLAALNALLGAAGAPGRVPVALGPLGQEAFHTAVGLTMAVIYALFFYQLLRGPGWLRGLAFCQIPWAIQAFVVLPWLGAGVLGLRLAAMTPLVSFALNALYGLVLGALYRPRPGPADTD